MAVGQRVFVNSGGNHPGTVALADESGKIVSAVELADGVEVEVVGWRPRGASDTRYRVRTSQGTDGWLPAGNLRKTLVPLPAPEAPAPGPVANGGGRRFGQHFEAERPVACGSLTPAQTAPVVPANGRRFGQRS